MSNRTGFSAQLWVADTFASGTSNPQYRQLSDLVMVSIPPLETAKVKTSNLASSGQFHTYAPGWSTTGVCGAEFNFTETLLLDLYALHGIEYPYRVIHADEGYQLDFTGFMSKGPEMSHDLSDEVSKIKIEIQPTGFPDMGEVPE